MELGWYRYKETLSLFNLHTNVMVLSQYSDEVVPVLN